MFVISNECEKSQLVRIRRIRAKTKMSFRMTAVGQSLWRRTSKAIEKSNW